MSRRMVAAGVVLVLAAASAWAFTYKHTSLVRVGDVNVTVTFTDSHSGGTGEAFQARHVRIRLSDAPTTGCYADTDGVAAVPDYADDGNGGLKVVNVDTLIGYGVDFDFDERDAGGGWASIGLICSSYQGEFRVEAWR